MIVFACDWQINKSELVSKDDWSGLKCEKSCWLPMELIKAGEGIS